MPHDPLVTLRPGRLDRRGLPMRLFAKAKRLGVWDPDSIELARDAADWRGFSAEEQDVLLRLTSLFLGGEESVAKDLLPLIAAVAREGRLEEELYLATFLWEEAKHVDFFCRFLDVAAGEPGDLSRFHTPSYTRLFAHELPEAMQRLETDPSPVALARASVTYNMIVEGVLAETGYHAYFQVLERVDRLPGLRAGLVHLARDESRHIAYGVYLLSRLAAAEPAVWPAIEERMGELLPLALAIIEELFSAYEEMPFGIRPEDFTDYATAQFTRRMERIERSRGLSPEALALEVEDGAGAE